MCSYSRFYSLHPKNFPQTPLYIIQYFNFQIRHCKVAIFSQGGIPQVHFFCSRTISPAYAVAASRRQVVPSSGIVRGRESQRRGGIRCRSYKFLVSSNAQGSCMYKIGYLRMSYLGIRRFHPIPQVKTTLSTRMLFS